MRRFMTKPLMLLILYSFSTFVLADSRVFKIEVVVFSQNKATSELFESYASEIEWPSRLADLSLFNRVETQYQSLHGIKERLNSRPEYNTMLHAAWTQKIRSNSISTAVQLSRPGQGVDGFFRMQRSHTLHIYMDMEFNPAGGPVYRISEKRRIKLNETHYLDHPKFGIIVRVSPIS